MYIYVAYSNIHYFTETTSLMAPPYPSSLTPRCSLRSHLRHLEVRGPSFEAMTGRTSFLRSLEVFRNFPSSKVNSRRLCTAPGFTSLKLLSLAYRVTEVILEASGRWLGTRIGTDDAATLA
jgi:hypothetical protein